MVQSIMSLKSQIIKLLGKEAIDNSSIPNLAIKRLFVALRISPGDKAFEFIRTLYRSNSRVTESEKFYSTFGEDRILACYLPELTGKYIDVGSGNPRNGSNTYLFYRRGWAGITIDPIKTVWELQKKKRPKDTQIIACISNSPEKQMEFHEYTADDFSTDSADRVQFLSNFGIKSVSTSKVDTLKLSSLVNPTGPLEPAFLDIDVEGNELSVLESNNWEIYLPRVVCIEEWKSPLYKGSPVRLFLEEKGYKIVSRAFITSIYVHSEYLSSKSEVPHLNSQWFQP
jgi:FkbM family methyltransferase